MPDRISVLEQYNNRDLIAQIYRIISLTNSSTIKRVTTTQEGSHVTVTLEMMDGTTKTFEFECVGDVTTDTFQTINALKHFMMGIGITGPTHIDGDVRIVNGHYLQLAGDLDVGGDTELAGDLIVHGQSEIGGMSIEESSGKTVISNDLGISTPSPFEVPTTDTGERDTYAANGTRVQNDLDNYAFMVRTSDNQTIGGTKTFSRPLSISNSGNFNWSNPANICGEKGGSEQNLNFMDANGTPTARIHHYINSNNLRSIVYLEAYNKKSADGTTVSASIIVVANTDGSSYALAPPTPTSAKSNEIATANWVISKINEFAAANNLQVIQ